MRRELISFIGVVCLFGTASHAETNQPWPVVDQNGNLLLQTVPVTPVRERSLPTQLTTGAIDPAPPRDPSLQAVTTRLENTSRTESDEAAGEDDALRSFYKDHRGPLLWVDSNGLNARAHSLLLEFANADAWGLDASAFNLSQRAPTGDLTPDAQADLELNLSRLALLYARHARGGRIMSPADMLNSHLNRSPQLRDPNEIIQELAKAPDPAAYLTSLHPKHLQFQRLRQAYLSVRARNQTRIKALRGAEQVREGDRDARVVALRKRLGLAEPVDVRARDLFDDKLADALRTFQQANNLEAANGVLNKATLRHLNRRAKMRPDKLRANMEMWRWMWDDLGDMHVLANVPEFILTFKKNGKTLFRERAVVGQVSKQTSIFTRTLKHIVLRPMWRVPESIKVRELWPSLKRGGGLMRQYGLKVETKDGKPVNWRRINWHRADIRNYEVVQPPGRRSVMGKVKFSFPSQHTIFIHDTPDKYMFRSRRRTFSHGCLRLQNPMKLARLILKEDKGWDSDHVEDLVSNGPNRNAIKIESRIPMHLVYFTVWVDDDGRLKSFSDIYGHEKRVRQGLAGQWTRIAKGRNHLAPPQPIVSRNRSVRQAGRERQRNTRPSQYINRAFSGDFF